MRELGIVGVIRGKRKRPVDADPRETRPADLVDRHFARFRVNQLWVADFTYVWTYWFTSRSYSTPTPAGSSAGGPPPT